MTKKPDEFLYGVLERTLEHHASSDMLESLRKHEDLTFDSLELSSLHIAEVLIELEDDLGVGIEEAEFDNITKISDLVSLIESRMPSVSN